MAPSTVQAPASAAPAVATHAPPPSPVAFVQEISTSLIAEVSASAALVGPVMAPPSTIVVPLLSASVATTSAPEMPPLPFSTPLVSPSAVLASTSPSFSSHPSVSSDPLHTPPHADPP